MHYICYFRSLVYYFYQVTAFLSADVNELCFVQIVQFRHDCWINYRRITITIHNLCVEKR